jgi:pilus assembly protein CpaB
MTIEDVVIRRRGECGSRGVLLAGLFLGLVAAILIALVLSRGDGDGVATNNGRVAVVAVKDIPARTRITRDMLEVRDYEAGAVNLDAFTSANQLVNRVTAVAVKAGQPILPSQVSASTGEGLNFAVSEGMRAVSISASEVAIAGGNVSPGNRVDVVGAFKMHAGDAGPLIAQFTGEPFGRFDVPEGGTVTFTLLQNVRILAVAQKLPEDTAAPSQDTENSVDEDVRSLRASPEAATITLEVTPQQAQILAVADLQGDLRLSLRAFGDASKAPVTPIVVLLDD